MLKKAVSALVLTLGLCAAAYSSASACFGLTQNCTVYIMCSYNSNGTGGYYIAHVYRLVSADCAF